jgi:hypothetical protein
LGTRGFPSKGNGTSWKLVIRLAKFKWQVATLALSTALSATAATTAGVRTASTGATAAAVRPCTVFGRHAARSNVAAHR